MAEDRNTLLNFLARHYTLDEMKTLCFKLFVDYDNLGGDTGNSWYYAVNGPNDSNPTCPGPFGVLTVTTVLPARGIAPGRASALRASYAMERLHPRERRLSAPLWPEILQFREEHWKVRFRYRHDAADIAVDHRDRRSPVPLATDAPVAEAELLSLIHI